MQQARIGLLVKGAKKLGMKVKTSLNKRRMLKQLKKAGYDPKATSGPKTLSATIARQKKKEKVKKFINMPDKELKKYSPTYYMGKDAKNYKELGIKNEEVEEFKEEIKAPEIKEEYVLTFIGNRYGK